MRPLPPAQAIVAPAAMAPAPAPVAVAPAAVAASAAPAPPPPASAPTSTSAPARIVAGSDDPVEMFNRMRQAEHRVAQVAAYLAAKPGAAPMWNDPAAEAEASQLRARLNARKGSKLELSRPNWRLQADSASLSADYRCRSAGNAPCEGRLDVKLVWREGLWFVRNVGVGPSA
jgi:hypothetical protein